MGPILHDFDQARRDLFAPEKGLDELVPEKPHEGARIRTRDGNQRSIRGHQAVFCQNSIDLPTCKDDSFLVGNIFSTFSWVH